MIVCEQYDQLIRPEIESLIKEVEAALPQDSVMREACKGWRVFFSPLISKPKILFIGINPGNGQEGMIDLDYHDKERLEYLQYWDDETQRYIESTYSLAKETKEAFKLAGLSEVLEESAVKTNFFFLSTVAEKDLYTLTTYLGRGKSEVLLGDKIFSKAYEWTRKLIEIIEPQIVICEGKTAYNNVTDLFPVFGEWKDWEDNCAYTLVPTQNLAIIGYSRTFSNINNKPALASLLQRFIKN
jgi:uracil-DNA glycosylase